MLLVVLFAFSETEAPGGVAERTIRGPPERGPTPNLRDSSEVLTLEFLHSAEKFRLRVAYAKRFTLRTRALPFCLPIAGRPPSVATREHLHVLTLALTVSDFISPLPVP